MNSVKLQDIKLMYRNPLHFCTLEMIRSRNSENNNIYSCIKNNKTPWNKFKQVGENLYSENYKAIKKKLKRTQISGRIYHGA